MTNFFSLKYLCECSWVLFVRNRFLWYYFFLSCLGLNFVQISSQIISCLGIVLIFDLHEQNQVLVMISVVSATCKCNRNNVLHYFQKSNMWWQNVYCPDITALVDWVENTSLLPVTSSFFSILYIVSNNNNFNSISGLVWAVSFFWLAWNKI